MSKMKQKPIGEATVPELIEFATNMGIEVSKSATRAIVLAKLQPAWEHDYIMITEQPAPKAEIVKPTADQDTSKDAKVAIFIDMQEGPGGEEPVPLSVNGRAIWVPRGQICEVAQRYVEVLEHAKTTTYSQDKDGNMIPRTVYTYPWRRVTQGEMRAA